MRTFILAYEYGKAGTTIEEFNDQTKAFDRYGEIMRWNGIQNATLYETMVLASFTANAVKLSDGSSISYNIIG